MLGKQNFEKAFNRKLTKNIDIYNLAGSNLKFQNIDGDETFHFYDTKEYNS